MTWNYFWAGNSGDQPRYHQFSYRNCAVGCGPVAWAILIGWADRQAAFGNAYWAGRWGLYRENGGRGADAVAPIHQDDGVKNMIVEIHHGVGTFCLAGQGATTPWGMGGVASYLNGRTGARAVTHYNVLGIHETRLANDAASSIAYRRTPAVIGTGWFSHYPVAWGYAWQRRIVRKSILWFEWTETVTDTAFYVNQGWGGGGHGQWIDAGTWFAGELYP
ncbi:MAG: hypothetical protein QM708_01965 [Propioniciclava sp.]|uniref:hypothetical protein n=1 Tax=Propioniciclava sp. TaxID=2038686 RepID=UPI0039E40D6F